ncbi:PLP-dependent aminotransferase family protein [Paenibacillus flagellatus]|uniref:PLP-dependent aminotransferase family protein n=1 Tax=Paenibacillus flagellatus TaxID=2211139 RepID=A0A2V5K7Y2_9BACL|nr:PLP-dependent aminotransferase family protein [Paenibacillus flagellatus]PYI55458.1 PLP-dependent aminotransferase family protein [Paenibacillus flagellatus]
MFNDFELTDDRPVYIQVKDYLKRLIGKGSLRPGQKLPSTRELGLLLSVSRNTVIAAYAELESDGFVYAVRGKGSYVAAVSAPPEAAAPPFEIDWLSRINGYARQAVELDRMKNGIRADKNVISFTSIAPDEKLFDLEQVKRAFLDRMAIEGNVLLNYGYAKGYKPLIDYLLTYMERKGVDLSGKDMLITSGFTEAFDIVLSALRRKEGGSVLCENPTHYTAIKNFKLNGYDITGIPMEQDGIHLSALERALSERTYDCAYLIPSYHNPTGIVTSPAKRMAVMQLMARHGVPVIEDGFNEELRYSGSHVSPLIATAGRGNGVIYLGSFSKVLFPGLRVGWVLADRRLVDSLESIKRSRSIHTSTLDQSLLYQYLQNGNFEKYLKKARSEYKRKYEWTKLCCETHLPYKRLSGDGGLHLFVEFEAHFDTTALLRACADQGVIFTPGDMFYTDGGGRHTMRLGFSRVSDEHIARGLAIIGRTARRMLE